MCNIVARLKASTFLKNESISLTKDPCGRLIKFTGLQRRKQDSYYLNLSRWANEQQDSSNYEGVEAIELAITAQRRS